MRSWPLPAVAIASALSLLGACSGGGGGSESEGASGATSTSGGGTSSATSSSSASAGETGGGSGASSSGASTTGSGGASSSGGATSTSGGGGPPILEPDIVPIFNTSCGALDIACHARVAYAAASESDCRGWLSLEDEPLGAQFYGGDMDGQPTGCPDRTLFERLTELDAWQCEAFDPRIRYVVPCDPEGSYLLRKTNGGPYCKNAMGEVTQPMPPGKVIDPAELALIEAWIAAGAPTLADPDGVDCRDVPPDLGEPPVAAIFHPGDGEERKVDLPIPFIGEANDLEDGPIPAAKMIWSSDLEGMIGSGANFDAALTVLGAHTITLSVEDSDGNVGEASIQINVVP